MGEPTQPREKPSTPEQKPNRGPNRHNQNRPHRHGFEGREPTLKGFVFDLASDPDQFIRTTKKITNFVGRTYNEYTATLSESVKRLELVIPTAHNDPDTTNLLEFEVWKLSIKEFAHQTKVFNDFKAGLYNLILGQCTDALEDKLKSHRGAGCGYCRYTRSFYASGYG
jgi:hypothetical protein